MRLALRLAVTYLLGLICVLLYPFDFSSPFGLRANSVEWLSDAGGVRFGKSGMLVSAAPPAAVFRRLVTGEGLAIELWLNTASADQRGPARIISYSRNPWERNFTLAQQGESLVFRLRNTQTDANVEPGFDVPGVFVPGKMQHIVVTYDLVQRRVYVDGRLRAASTARPGDFENWDPSCLLVFGNEATGGRPWNGVIAYVAIYDRAMPERAVAARYANAGRAADSGAETGRILAYDFKRGLGSAESRLNDDGTVAPAPILESPRSVPTTSRMFLLYDSGKMIFTRTSAWDLTRNVILFLPFGVFGFAIARHRGYSVAMAVCMSAAVAAILSATLEALQFFLEARTSSILDVGTNSVGALAGAVGAACCERWVRGRFGTT